MVPNDISIIPILKSINDQGFKITGSNINGNSVNNAYRMVDRTLSSGFRSGISPAFPATLYITFPKEYLINSYTVYINNSYMNMHTWDFYGLVNGSYVLLHSGENPTNIASSITGKLTPIRVSGIGITCKSRYGSNSWGILELEVFEAKKYLIKQNEQYYSIKDGSLALLGIPADDSEKQQWFDNYGVGNLKGILLTPDENGNKLIDSLDNKFEVRMMVPKS